MIYYQGLICTKVACLSGSYLVGATIFYLFRQRRKNPPAKANVKPVVGREKEKDKEKNNAQRALVLRTYHSMYFHVRG